MSTTSDSTGQDDRDRERRLGSVLWDRTKPLLDELDELRAKQPTPVHDPTKAEAKKKRAAHARATKTERLHAVIDALVESNYPQLVAWTGSRRSRAEWAKKQIKAKADDNTLVPGWRYIDEYLKTLQL